MNNETISFYFKWLDQVFVDKGMNEILALGLSTLINCLIVILLVTLFDVITRKVVVKSFRIFSARTKTNFDNFLVESNFPRYVAHIIPLGLVWYFEPFLFYGYPLISKVLIILIDLYIVLLSVMIIRSVLRTTMNYLNTKEKYSDKPLKSYVQILMIFAWGIGIFFFINIITGYSLASLTTLGAASAALLLIFRDTILGFVASIQVTVNDIVRIGDWITFSKYGADGNVTEINLASVRVQNFDNTFTTIPTYSLISDSFQNWRGMADSDGRRIKRAIYIKTSSVKFLSEKEIEEFKNIKLVTNYIQHRQKDIEEANSANNVDKSLLINGRNQSNLGIFRKYLDAYLHNHPAVHKEMLLMVRYLAPTEKGIPVEIYCFSKDKRWENYEHIQAEILDHTIAAVSYFDLELFELPTGKDFSHL